MGIVDYLPKPFSPALLIDVTAKAISFVKSKGIEEVTSEEQEITAKAEEIKNVIVSNKDRPGGLIPVLQQVQEILGYLPPAVLKLIARGLNLPVSEVHGVVSFYSFFTMKPKGKHNVRVCMGTACYVKRATEILDKLKDILGIEEEEVTEDKQFSLETVRCLGACGLAPVVVVDHDTHGSVDPVKVSGLLEEYN
ncbi:MAG: NAD(P)H-dependent oxidoreductase subunit E [Nitrospirota bacterium]|nr:MAG: NAD(P)H-dependent oxidoreductase subunit E [Nitrospirota bacterium]